MAPTAGRPLSDDAEAAGKPVGAQASPQLGTVAAAGRPLGVEPRQKPRSINPPAPKVSQSLFSTPILTSGASRPKSGASIFRTDVTSQETLLVMSTTVLMGRESRWSVT